jgi:hypothetical protein
MLGELLVIVGAELILLVSIAAMTLHDLRMDVLSGRYFSNQGNQIVSLDWSIDELTRLVERERNEHRIGNAPVRASNDRRPRPSASRSHLRIIKTIFLNRRLAPIPLIPGLSDIDNRAVPAVESASRDGVMDVLASP